MTKTEFGNWLRKVLADREWNQSKLASRSGLSTGQISRLINGTRGPGKDTCRAIAKGLELPIDVVLQVAEIRDPEPEEDLIYEILKDIFYRMTGEEREVYLATGRVTIEMREKRERRQQ